MWRGSRRQGHACVAEGAGHHTPLLRTERLELLVDLLPVVVLGEPRFIARLLEQRDRTVAVAGGGERSRDQDAKVELAVLPAFVGGAGLGQCGARGLGVDRVLREQRPGVDLERVRVVLGGAERAFGVVEGELRHAELQREARDVEVRDQVAGRQLAGSQRKRQRFVVAAQAPQRVADVGDGARVLRIRGDRLPKRGECAFVIAAA